MSPGEIRRLGALEKRLRETAKKSARKMGRMRNKAGRSSEEGGTGDEGWREMLELCGAALAYRHSADELTKLLIQFRWRLK